jgi:hypothetical protein
VTRTEEEADIVIQIYCAEYKEVKEKRGRKIDLHYL